MRRILGKYMYNLVILCMAGWMIAGCRTQKISETAERKDENDGAQSMISILEKKNHRFNTLKIKRIDVDYSMNGISEKIKGSIAIYRDSLIALSIVPALGYEALRILCTRDSVIVINRPEKTYSAASFEYFRKKYDIPVGFTDIQAMLANEVFYYKGNCGDRVYEKQLSTRKENHLFILDAFRDGNRITNQGIVIDRTGRRLESVFIMDYETKMRLNVDYENFAGNEAGFFPKNLRVDLVESNHTYRMDIKYGQVIFNDSLNVEFYVPKHYTRGDK